MTYILYSRFVTLRFHEGRKFSQLYNFTITLLMALTSSWFRLKEKTSKSLRSNVQIDKYEMFVLS